MLPDPQERPTLTINEVTTAYGIGINLARREANRYIATSGATGIPAFKIGRLLRFPTAAIRQDLGIDPPQAAPPHKGHPGCTPSTELTSGSGEGRPPGATHGSAPPVRIVPRHAS